MSLTLGFFQLLPPFLVSIFSINVQHTQLDSLYLTVAHPLMLLGPLLQDTRLAVLPTMQLHMH